MQINRKKKTYINSLESGSLSDLAFLLIIFFIVIAVFNINRGFLLSIPKKDSSKIVNVQDIIKINLKNNGELYFDGVLIDLKRLEEEITKRLKYRPNMTFYLVIEPEVEYQYVVNVIDIVRKLNVENFSFKMQE